MKYFGTNLTTHGHYTWDLSGEHMIQIGLMPKTPFNPYEINNSRIKGSVVFCNDYSGYSIIAIEGSCVDDRLGTKSVFWVEENLSKSEILEAIKSNKHAQALIDKMPFKVIFN